MILGTEGLKRSKQGSQNLYQLFISFAGNVTSNETVEIHGKEVNSNGLRNCICPAADGDGDDAARARNPLRRFCFVANRRKHRTHSLRMSWVVVTDGNGNRNLNMQCAAA